MPPRKEILDLSEADERLRNRFWSKVARSPVADGCWEWTAYRTPYGYGQFTLAKGHFVLAHNVAFAMTQGQILPGQVIRHRCDNPPCVRPEHLLIGSQRDNALDSVERGRARRSRGEDHPVAQLTEEAVRKLRRTPYYFGMYQELAGVYGVSGHALSDARRGKTWRWVA